MNISYFIKRHSVLFYFLLTFVISWGSFFFVGGQGFLDGTSWQSDPKFMSAVSVLVLGPPISGVLLTIFVFQKAGLSDFLSRLLQWRVDKRWYAVALLVAPLAEMVILVSLSQISPVFLPKILVTTDMTGLLLSGILVGLVGGFAEELGWTGFAIPKLRQRNSVFSTGLIVGVLWGVWHILQMWWVGRTSFETLSPVIFLSLYFLFAIAQLTAYRILMVWVYDRTKSLLVAVLMHASYIFSTLFVFAPPTTGGPFLIYSGIFTVVLWLIVTIVIVTNRSKFPLTS